LTEIKLFYIFNNVFYIISNIIKLLSVAIKLQSYSIIFTLHYSQTLFSKRNNEHCIKQMCFLLIYEQINICTLVRKTTSFRRSENIIVL